MIPQFDERIRKAGRRTMQGICSGFRPGAGSLLPDGTMAGFNSFHEWFRVPNTDAWVCPEPAATQGEPGATWSGECIRAGGEETGEAAKTLAYEVVGLETVAVGGEAVGVVA